MAQGAPRKPGISRGQVALVAHFQCRHQEYQPLEAPPCGKHAIAAAKVYAMNACQRLGDDPLRKRRQLSDDELDQIQDSLQGLQYGAVQIIVQDGVIVQIDRTEKRRLRRPETKRHG